MLTTCGYSDSSACKALQCVRAREADLKSLLDAKSMESPKILRNVVNNALKPFIGPQSP